MEHIFLKSLRTRPTFIKFSLLSRSKILKSWRSLSSAERFPRRRVPLIGFASKASIFVLRSNAVLDLLVKQTWSFRLLQWLPKRFRCQTNIGYVFQEKNYSGPVRDIRHVPRKSFYLKERHRRLTEAPQACSHSVKTSMSVIEFKVIVLRDKRDKKYFTFSVIM